ncbi:MAG: RES domain-containing protein [Chitinophagaceae bacterium]|nr:MAG: RES domain-containing protein [Chitinophagaceae bacterium]
MEVYRLSREKYASPLSGLGAALKGARWNSAGTELIYTASNRSLAMAEVAVHLSLATLPDDYLMLTIHIPEHISRTRLDMRELKQGWNSYPHHRATQEIGNRFVSENKYCLLEVPSAVTKGDWNLLINPAHNEFDRVMVVETVRFPFDKRIFE